MTTANSSKRRRYLQALLGAPLTSLASLDSSRASSNNSAWIANPSMSLHSLYMPLMWSNGRIPLAIGDRCFTRKPYVLERANGERVFGTTDDEGWTQPLERIGLEWVTLTLLA